MDAMTLFPLGERLPDDLLMRRDRLPLKPEPVTLDGKYVHLAPLVLDRDVASLFAISNGTPVKVGEREVGSYDADALIWRYLFAGPFATPGALASFLGDIQTTQNFLPLTVFDAPTRRHIGFAAYTNNAPQHLKVELGHIWYSPVAQGTNANLEASYLMLRHAFDLGYRRVEWKCDSLNERSRRAALRIGFRFEGIQEAHFIIKGRTRDTAWFRMLDREWPSERSRLEQMLYG